MKKREEIKAQIEELKAQQKDLEQELQDMSIREDIEILDEITDKLNSIFQHPTLEEHCEWESVQLYEIMQRIDKKSSELKERVEDTEDVYL
jgi:hypothetical protein